LLRGAGFDMSLVRESLRLTYEQRAILHQAALDLILEMERAGQALRDPTNPLIQPLCGADIDFVIARVRVSTRPQCMGRRAK
jgi:hypothetical protein